MEDTKTTENPTTEPNKTTSPEVKTVKKDPFSLIGKIAVILLIAALLVGGGYVLATKLGTKKDSSMQQATPTTSINSPTATPETTVTPSTVSKKTVKAGLSNDSTSFKPYSIEVPTGWTDSRDKTDITDKLTITKGAYSLSIYQAPMGGGACLYPGDAPSEMAQSFTDFSGITGGSNQYRRSWNKVGNPAGIIGYTVCQKSTIENSYGSPTGFGAISIKTPDPADGATLAEIDGMIASLKQ